MELHCKGLGICENVEGETKCLCLKCLNRLFQLLNVVQNHVNQNHVINYRFQALYTIWSFHKEKFNDLPINVPSPKMLGNQLIVMMNQQIFFMILQERMILRNLMECKKMTVQKQHNQGGYSMSLQRSCLQDEKYLSLKFLMKLMHLKVITKWSNKPFDFLLKLLKDIFLKMTRILELYYESKTWLRNNGLGYESIHICKYYYALF